MAICDHCGGLKLSERPCRKCGELANREDIESLPEWKRKKLRGARERRRAAAGQETKLLGLQPLDGCRCGDYRRDHDERGCRVCRSSNAPWDKPPFGPCTEFRPVGQAAKLQQGEE